MFAIALSASGLAQADGHDVVKGAFGETKPILDLRLRAENVDQDGIVNDAHATTLRLRAGFETGKAWNTALLIEGEGIVPIQKNYRPDPMVPTMTTYPVVPDPEGYEINRFQLTNTSLPGTTLTLGRQRLALDDQRFVGPVGWRQNEQTFDAFRVVNRSVANLVIDATYFNKVNRLFGEDSPQGDYQGDSTLLNVSYQTKVGKLTAFNYLLDFENIVGVPAAVRDSIFVQARENAVRSVVLTNFQGRTAYAVDYIDAEALRNRLYIGKDGLILDAQTNIFGIAPGGRAVVLGDLPPKARETVQAQADNSSVTRIDLTMHGLTPVYVVSYQRDGELHQIIVTRDGQRIETASGAPATSVSGEVGRQ